MAAPVLALLAAAPVHSAPLPPIGPWVVEAADDLCLLLHGYGAGDNKITVGFQPLFRGETMEVIVLTPATKWHDQRRGAAKLTFDAGGKPLDGDYFSVELPNGTRRLTRLTVSSAAFDQLKTASTLSIEAAPIDLTVEIKNPAKALTAFDTCQKDLLASWGVDSASLADDRAPKPQRPLYKLFSPDDYPREALRMGIVGRVITVLQVTPQGTVSNCRVVASAGKVLNDATCAIEKKATFDPGRDADGKPAASIYVSAVRWDQ